MVANATMLNKTDVIAYVGQNASNYGLDPAAVLAVANQEGLKSTPGSYWQDHDASGRPLGFGFGPPSWNTAGAGSAIVQAQGSVQAAANWAWTPAGLDYWMQQLQASGASGKIGGDAISTIVTRFERPAFPGPEVTAAIHEYASFLQQIQIPLPSLPTVTIPPIRVPGLPIPGQPGPGETQLPAPTNPTQTQTTVPAKFSLHILDLPSGPVNLTLPWDFSGILLFLAALFAIIIGALLWDKSRNVIVKGGEAAAVAA